jgi:hypothetical protein
MSYELHDLRGLWVDTESTFGTAKTFPGTFLAVPYREGSVNWQQMRQLLDPKLGKLLLDGHDVKVLGRKESSLKFDVPWHSHGTDMIATASVPTSSTWALLKILETLFGASVATGTNGANTTVQAGTTTTVVNVTAGHGARFVADRVIACEVASGSGLVEMREIDSVATDAITVKEAFSATPVTGSSVRGGVTVTLTEDPSGSLQFVLEGAEADDRVRLMGLMGGLKIDVPIGGEDFPKISFDMKGVDYARLGSGTAQALSYSVFSAVAAVFAELLVPTFGSTTRVAVDQSAFTLELDLKYAPIRTGGGVQNVLRHRRQATRPFAKGTFTTPYQDDTWYTARDNREVRSIYQQIGNIPGSASLISVPRVQITDVQAGASAESIAGQVVSFEGRHDNGATAFGYSVARLHFS